MKDLIDRLQGRRNSPSTYPPIMSEAAERIKELEEAIELIQGAREVSENPLDLIDNICAEVAGS